MLRQLRGLRSSDSILNQEYSDFIGQSSRTQDAVKAKEEQKENGDRNPASANFRLRLFRIKILLFENCTLCITSALLKMPGVDPGPGKKHPHES